MSKEQIHRLYTSGSCDFVDSDGDVRSIADLDDHSMEVIEESLPPLFMEAAAVVSLKRAVTTRHPRRADRRGGRAYNEGSDSEHDPFWSIDVDRLSDEQRERNHRGAEAARAVLRSAREATNE